MPKRILDVPSHSDRCRDHTNNLCSRKRSVFRPNPITICAALALIGLAVPHVAVQVRRFHDQDKSGWFALLNLVPYPGPFIVAGFMLIEGTQGDNQYGPDPKSKDSYL